MASQSSLVIHVIRARGLQLKKHKQLDVYVSMSTIGESKWKSKVSTSPIRTVDGNCEFGEHCEFELTSTDRELHVSVNYKTAFGTTESLGQFVFEVNQMKRYQSPTWFQLTKKKNEAKDYGRIQLEYQFSNRLSASVSSFSLNKMEKEKKFEKLKRKLNLIGKSKKAVATDDQSMVSVPLSRRSSITSNASALAFSSPSPNHMSGAYALPNATPPPSSTGLMLAAPENQVLPPSLHTTAIEIPTIDGAFRRSTNSLEPQDDKSTSKNLVDEPMEIENSPNNNLEPPKSNITTKVRQRAEQFLHLRHRKHHASEQDDATSETGVVGSGSFRSKAVDIANNTGSRPSSIASSSGFASLGSNNLGALNENTSTEHLLNVIKHLRREILAKDHRIHDLEEYTDRLLSKIIVYYPELLQVGAVTNSNNR